MGLGGKKECEGRSTNSRGGVHKQFGWVVGGGPGGWCPWRSSRRLGWRRCGEAGVVGGGLWVAWGCAVEGGNATAA